MALPDIIQCDEARPECKKCTNFGVTCNFDPKIPDLQMCGGGSGTLKPEVNSFQLNQRPRQLSPKLETPESLHPAVESTIRLDRELLDRFNRFYSRTALTIGTQKAAVFMRDATFELCFSVGLAFTVLTSLTS
jgi:hypothetical protein